MKVFIGADHRGVDFKKKIIKISFPGFKRGYKVLTFTGTEMVLIRTL